MEYKCKSTFAESVVKTLEATGWGKLISIQEIDGHDCLTVDMGPMEVPQYPINPVMATEQVRIHVSDKEMEGPDQLSNFPG